MKLLDIYCRVLHEVPQVVSVRQDGDDAGESVGHRQAERRQQLKNCGCAEQPIVNQLNMQLIKKKIHLEKPFQQLGAHSGENAVLELRSSLGMCKVSEAIRAFSFLFLSQFLFLSFALLLFCETHIPVYPCRYKQQQRSGHQTYRINSYLDLSAGLQKRQSLKKQVRGRRLTPTGISCH